MSKINKITDISLIRFYEKYMTLIGSFGHLIFVFQTYKILVNKSANDISLEGFLIAFISIMSWFFYGILKKDKILVRVNIFGLITSSVCIITIIYLKYFKH